MSTGSWRHVSRTDPCEICGRGNWCSRSVDRTWSICRRVEAGGERRVDRAGMEYWLHSSAGAADGHTPPAGAPSDPARQRASSQDLDRVYRALLGLLGLSDAHRQALAERGLDAGSIVASEYRSLPRAGRAALARELLQRFPPELLLTVPGIQAREHRGAPYLTIGGPAGLVVPVRDLTGRIAALKVRCDDPKDGPKYLYVSSAARGGPGPGAPVHVPLRSAKANSAPQVRVTEGELKADVATLLSGVPTISVPGVSAWRAALPVLADLAPQTVLLAFDADAESNPLVARAGVATARALVLEGYDVVVERWQGLLAKGIDDALAAKLPIQRVAAGPAEAATSPTEPRRSNGDPGYRSTPDGLFLERQSQSGPARVRLTNFRAHLAADILEDDGADVRRRFEVEARLNGSCRRFTVTAEAFAGMGWVTEQLGARAIVFPGIGVRDQARAAIQYLSGDIPERRVYSHTGWRHLPDGWAYLHAGGAIGSQGPVPGVEVALPGALSLLTLPDPPAGEELAGAIRACLRLADVGPDHITIPLLGAAFRAVMGDIDFAIHLAGPTGAGKSELAALVQQHFGPGLDARHLPGSWSSTANALELLAFSAKDAILVLDDFAPTGDQSDAERAHRGADRVLRAQGNQSGRLRMRADGTLRAAKPPRGLLVSTGEDVPRGQSIRARILTCELGPHDLDWTRITEAQKDAAEGRYGQTLAGFVAWIAPQHDGLLEGVHALVPRLRDRAAQSAAHRRTPHIVGNLAAGWSVFLQFGQAVGAISEADGSRIWGRVWSALGRAASVQAHHQRGGDPAQRFLELLGSALASGRAHLAAVDGGAPPAGGTWGWRRKAEGEWEPLGDRVGWLAEGGHVYLDSDASYAAAQRLGQEVGDRLGLTPQVLRKRLKEGGCLVSTDLARQVLTVRRMLEGRRRDVLHLSSTTWSGPEAPPSEISREARGSGTAATSGGTGRNS